MKILVTGATGLVGKKIIQQLLQNGLKINYLTTSTNKIQDQPNYKGFYWNPKTNEINEKCLLGVYAIIHLAGASIAEKWTDAYKEEILQSRVLSSKLLYETLKNNNHQVEQIISASAIGIYPDSLDAVYDEGFKDFNISFLSHVVVKWEQAVKEIEKLNVKVCLLRIGLVLSKEGGALPKIMQPAKLGLGAAFGSGEQWQSWIHINDLCKMFIFSLEKGLEGNYNAVAPEPVTNYELSKSVSKVLKRPFFLPNIPKFVMKFLLGEMHILLFESQNVDSKKIQNQGFNFEYKFLLPALKDLLQ
jgi:uncharacterized protein